MLLRFKSKSTPDILVYNVVVGGDLADFNERFTCAIPVLESFSSSFQHY